MNCMNDESSDRLKGLPDICLFRNFITVRFSKIAGNRTEERLVVWDGILA